MAACSSRCSSCSDHGGGLEGRFPPNRFSSRVKFNFEGNTLSASLASCQNKFLVRSRSLIFRKQSMTIWTFKSRRSIHLEHSGCLSSIPESSRISSSTILEPNLPVKIEKRTQRTKGSHQRFFFRTSVAYMTRGGKSNIDGCKLCMAKRCHRLIPFMAECERQKWVSGWPQYQAIVLFFCVCAFLFCVL